MSDSVSLRSKATSGVIWSAFERFGQQGCAFFVQLVLARLLAPEAFGLIAMVVVFISISSVLIDAGFSRALVQRKEVTDSDLSTVFYFNLLVTVILSSALYFCAPLVAAFYELEELSQILRFLCLGLLVSGFGAVHRSLLTRNLLFKKLFWVSFPSVLFSGFVGIGMAYSGFGVWALVAQVLCMRIVSTIFLWFQSGWRPTLVFDFKCLKEMFPYGSRLAVSGVLDQGFQNAYVLVIGRVFSAVDVGLFQRARSFQQLPVQNVQSILSRVAFPLFASIQNDPIRMKRGMKKAIQISCLFIFAGMALLAAIAEPMIVTLIGEKWLPCVPYLQWLCVAGTMYPLHAMNINLLSSIGRSDLFLRLEVLKKVLIAVNILLTFRFGVQVMIYGMIVTSFVSLILNAYYTKKFINYGILEQCRDLWRVCLLACLIWGSAFAFVQLTSWLSFYSLFASVMIGALIFFFSLRFMHDTITDEIHRILMRLPMGPLLVRIVL